MPLYQVNALDDRPDTDAETVARWLAAAPGAPVVVMIHGFRFHPGHPKHCPHRHILSLAPPDTCDKAVSWPRHLGVGRSQSTPEALCIAFGWSARGSVRRAWRHSARAGRALALLLGAIRHHDRHRPVGIIAHSMGARVALGALPRLPRGAVGRLVLLAAAALRSDATRALASPAGASAEVFNVTSRENDLFDCTLECLLLAPERLVGAGLKTPATNWIDLQIDTPAIRHALRRLGFPVARPKRLVCHWSGYLRPGLFPLYRALLTDPGALPLATLARAVPHRQHPRWSRLVPWTLEGHGALG